MHQRVQATSSSMITLNSRPRGQQNPSGETLKLSGLSRISRPTSRQFGATSCGGEILIHPSGNSFSPTPLGCTKKGMPPLCHSHHPSCQPHLISLPSFICQNQILIGLPCDGASVNAPWRMIERSWLAPPAQHTAEERSKVRPVLWPAPKAAPPGVQHPMPFTFSSALRQIQV